MFLSELTFRAYIKSAINCLDTPICTSYRLKNGHRVIYFKSTCIAILLEH